MLQKPCGTMTLPGMGIWTLAIRVRRCGGHKLLLTKKPSLKAP